MPIGHSGWRKKECDFLEPKGVFRTRGHVMGSNPREAILDNIFKDDHVGLTILYCLGDISMVMIIWKYSLV